MMVCSVCKSPVYENYGAWFHDVKADVPDPWYVRQVATMAKEVEDVPDHLVEENRMRIVRSNVLARERWVKTLPGRLV